MESLEVFNEKVFEKLEYINYPELVVCFETHGVVRCIAHTITECFRFNLSPMKTACIIYGCTWEYQIVPMAKGMVKH